MGETRGVRSRGFYSQYHGHPVEDLARITEGLREEKESLVFLVGDSSLDNKYWFSREEPAVNGYEKLLTPAISKCDVAYHVNREFERRSRSHACVNAAVEATTLSDRNFGGLLAQDRLVRDVVRENDVVVVSVGGNDIALAPMLCTCLNIVPLLCSGFCCGEKLLDACSCACPPDVYTPTNGLLDCGCLCCGLPGCLAGLCGAPLGLGYFVDLFGNRVRSYVHRLVAKTKPKLVVVCMIYYLDVHGRDSWANATLKLLCYDSRPRLLQHATRLVYEFATKRIRVPGTRVLPVPLFAVLDGSDTDDYVARVEPSVQGGAKLADALVSTILSGQFTTTSPPTQAIHRPSYASM